MLQADVTEEWQVERLFDEATEAFGAVGILVNDAGVDASGIEVGDLPTEVFDKAINANLYGPFFCCRRYVQLRKASGETGGKIHNIASVHEEIPNPGGADYNCSKGALHGRRPDAQPGSRRLTAHRP